MIERRDLLRGAAVGVILTSAQVVSACSWADYENDTWGERLVNFLQKGEVGLLNDLFRDHSTLVAFESSLIDGSENLSFAGASAVRNAMIAFRNHQIENGIGGTPRLLESAKIIGNEQQGRMNKIELVFSEKRSVETSCGPTRSAQSVDLYYQAGVHESGDDWVKWSIERIALMPRLEIDKFNAYPS